MTSLRTQFHSDFVTQKKPWRSFREANFPKVPSNVSLYQMTIVIFHKGISANSRLKSAGSYRPRMRRCQSLYFETCSYRPRIHFFSSSNSKKKEAPKHQNKKKVYRETKRLLILREWEIAGHWVSCWDCLLHWWHWCYLLWVRLSGLLG